MSTSPREFFFFFLVFYFSLKNCRQRQRTASPTRIVVLERTYIFGSGSSHIVTLTIWLGWGLWQLWPWRFFEYFHTHLATHIPLWWLKCELVLLHEILDEYDSDMSDKDGRWTGFTFLCYPSYLLCTLSLKGSFSTLRDWETLKSNDDQRYGCRYFTSPLARLTV